MLFALVCCTGWGLGAGLAGGMRLGLVTGHWMVAGHSIEVVVILQLSAVGSWLGTVCYPSTAWS